MARIGFGNWSLRTAGRNGSVQKTAYQPSDYTVTRRQRSRYTIRLWSVRHSRFLERLYTAFADLFLKLHPLWRALGYKRVERPVTFVERHVKGLLFDCRMCGQCVLSSTGSASTAATSATAVSASIASWLVNERRLSDRRSRTPSAQFAMPSPSTATTSTASSGTSSRSAVAISVSVTRAQASGARSLPNPSRRRLARGRTR